MSLLDLKTAASVRETEHIRRITLEPVSGALPPFSAGAAITLHIPGVGRRRYSLVETAFDADGMARPARYQLGIRLEPAGGGSRFMHALEPGAVVRAEPPQNDFALGPGTGPVLLVAGGIGVTPLVSKAAALRAAGRPFRLVYAARHADDFAFLDELRAIAGGGLTLHADAQAGSFLDVPGLLAGLAPDTEVHVCGPQPMMAAAIGEARRLGWPAGRLVFERFYSLGDVAGAPAAVPAALPASVPAAVAAADGAPASSGDTGGDGSFEVEVAATGQVVRVLPDQSIVTALVEAGLDPLHDCMKGECGVCQVSVIEGVPDHRDSILSEREREAGKVMQICVSRSKSPRLKIDL